MKKDKIWLLIRSYVYGPRKFLKSSRILKHRLQLPRGAGYLVTKDKWGREVYFDGNHRVIRSYD